MSDELAEAVGKAIATALWSKADAELYFDPRYAAMRDVRYGQAMKAARAAIAVVIERCAKVADKRADDRFAEHGVTEYDTNASYYSGSRAEAYDELDEEDWAIARDIRKLGESDDRG